ncbi:hypothetical protein BDY24DRAFT_88345 [Mrakia frigida]|uniref:uncharacterized protein n=1 Tax=Mrakia frigida TaxID=29902 RepID=UPI003FCC1728
MVPRLLILLLSFTPLYASAFTFTFNNTGPSMCDPVLVEWSGGQPPFRLLIIPAYDYPSDIALDTADTWTNSSLSGSFVWTANYPVRSAPLDPLSPSLRSFDVLTFPIPSFPSLSTFIQSGRRYVAVMSDTNGLATGGVSDIMTVATGGNNTCTARSSDADFYFYLDPQSGAVNQCGERWKNNIASGTNYILTMLDSGAFGNGGTSDFLTVGPSSDSSCIDASSPSQTPGSTWGTSDGKAATTASTTPTPQGSSLSTGGIAGVVIAGIIGLAAIQIVLFWFFCRTRFRRTLASSPVDLFNNKHEGADVGAPVTHNGRNFLGRRQRDVSAYLPDPYQLPQDGEEGRALQGDSSPGGSTGDPFDDEGGYLHAGSVRRGSDSTVLTDLSPPGTTSYTGYPPSSTSNSNLLTSPSPGYSASAVSPLSSSTFTHQQSNPSSPITTTSGTLYPTPSVVRQTKAMLALNNPDDDMEPPEGQPPRPGPSYHRHQDAGPIELDGPRPARPGEQIDLPPLYSDLGR